MNKLVPLVTCLAVLLTACNEKTASQQEPAAAPPAETQSSSLRVYKDPVTGELTTPPDDEIRRQNLETSINTMDVKKSKSVEMIPLEGGGYRAPLGDQFKVETRATIQPDGSIVIEETMTHPE